MTMGAFIFMNCHRIIASMTIYTQRRVKDPTGSVIYRDMGFRRCFINVTVKTVYCTAGLYNITNGQTGTGCRIYVTADIMTP